MGNVACLVATFHDFFIDPILMIGTDFREQLIDLLQGLAFGLH